MSINREQVVTCARSFVGTPFGHQGRTKGTALDCVGLPLCVSEELGIKDVQGGLLHGKLYHRYGQDPADNFVLLCCAKHLRRKWITDLKPGDVLCMRVETLPCHVAIYAGEIAGVPHIIHAYSGGVGKCVEHPLDYRWRRRITAVFEFPEVED